MLGGSSLLSARPSADRYNVLFIAVDDLRPELGCYGHPIVKSPNIDRLAAQSLRFARAYCQMALCAPSRASLLSGRRPDTNGIYNNSRTVHEAAPDLPSLPRHFRNHGYQTISIVKIYHNSADDPEGWTERDRVNTLYYASPEWREYQTRRYAEADSMGYTPQQQYRYGVGPATENADVPDNAYKDGQVADAAVAMLQKYQDQRFFLAAGFIKPHLPFCAPKQYWDLYDRDRLPLPDATEPADAPDPAMTDWGELRPYLDIPEKGDVDEAVARRLIHGYYACVSYVDAQVGRLLDELKRLELDQNTIVILWGDHGWKLGEYGDWSKGTNFEYDVNAPLLLHVPGQYGGRVCDALTEFVDIYPTLAELCGLPVPEHCEGLSMAPLLENPELSWKTAAFSQYHRGKLMGYSMRTGQWRHNEWVHRETGVVEARELYDQSQGPFVRENLVNSPKYRELVDRLAARMQAGWREAMPE